MKSRMIYLKALKQFVGLKILKFFDAGADLGYRFFLTLDPGWKNSDTINIPDPQPWLFVLEMDMILLSLKFILILRLSTGCRRTATACYCVEVVSACIFIFREPIPP